MSIGRTFGQQITQIRFKMQGRERERERARTRTRTRERERERAIHSPPPVL